MEKSCKTCANGGVPPYEYPCTACLRSPLSDAPKKWQPAENFATDTNVGRIDVDRMKEIVQAEREGRLVILPCKRGETVWCLVWDRSVVWPDESRRKIITRTFDLDDVFEVGKTVFLTREEAEKALEEAR